MAWIFLVVGLLLMTWSAATLWCDWASPRWPAAEGEVVWSMVWERRGSRSGKIFYRPEVRYRYAVGPTSYSGRRLRFVALPTNFATAAAASEVLAGLAPGAKVAVFYHPRLPRLAVVRPGAGAGSLAPLGVGAILVCLAALDGARA